MENELENNIPVPAPEVEKGRAPVSQDFVDSDKKTVRGKRIRGNKKNKDFVVDSNPTDTSELQGDFAEGDAEDENHVELDQKNGSYEFVASQESISDLEREKEEIIASLRAFDRQKRAIYNMKPVDADVQLEDVDSLVRNAENRLTGVEKKLSEISRTEPLPEVPPPFQPDVLPAQIDSTQSELGNSDVVIYEKKRELNPQQEAVVEKVFNDPRFKEKCESIGIIALFQQAFEKMYGMYRDEPDQQDIILVSLEEEFNRSFTASFPNIKSPLITQAIFQLFMGEYDDEYQKKYPDNDFSSESKAVELVPQSEVVPEVVNPVGEIPTETSPRAVSPVIDTNSPRGVKVSFDSNGNPLSVVVQVPPRDSVSMPASVTPVENLHAISETPVVLENSAGAPLVIGETGGDETSKKSAESSETQPEKIEGKSAGIETPTVLDTAKKEIENNKALKEARSAFANADGWLGKNGFTSRDIATIEKNYQKASTEYASSVTKTSRGSGVRVNLLKPAPQLSDVINDYVASLSTSGAAFVDIRHAKKFFASDDQKNALAQGLKKYFETRKEYEDGKKDVARGMWEQLGGVDLQQDLILKRDGISDDRAREAATVQETKAINELRSGIFEEAIVREMERLNQEKIAIAIATKKGILQRTLEGVRNINPTVRRAFATAVATGVISLGVSTAGVGTLGVLAGYAGARYIRSLIAASVGTGVGELQGKLLGSLADKLHNSNLSGFQERLLSVEGGADFDKFIDDYARERDNIFKRYFLTKKIVVGSTIVTSIALGAITSAELHGLLNVDLGDHPVVHSDQHGKPATSNLNNHGSGGRQSLPASPASSSNTPAPADQVGNVPKTGDAPQTTPPSDVVGTKPSASETAPAVPKTGGVTETGQSAPKIGEHKFFGPTVSPELEKIAPQAKSLEATFGGEKVKLDLKELQNAAVVGKGGSAWGVVHKQLELLAKSGVDPKQLGLNITADEIRDHAKFSHALEIRTRSILVENGFISNTGDVRIASPDTRLGLTVTLDEKGNTHFVIEKPTTTDRPVFYEYHPTQRLSVPVNHIPPEVPSNHTSSPLRSGDGILHPRVNIDTIPHADYVFSSPNSVSSQPTVSSDQKIVLDKNFPNSPLKQSDIDVITNSHEVAPKPHPLGLEKTPPPLPRVDHLISEKTLTKLFPEDSKEVLFMNYQKDIPKLRDFLENMGFSDAYIETRWQDLSRISVGEFQKHIDEILKYRADAKLLSQPIHPIHFNKDLVPTILSRNLGADIPAEDRLYKIADLINDKKKLIKSSVLEQRQSVAQFIVNQALYGKK